MTLPPTSAACASSCGSGTRPSPAGGHTGETLAAARAKHRQLSTRSVVVVVGVAGV